MNDATRRAVAYIAGRLARSNDSNSVYDFNARRHFHFSGAVGPGSVQIYDFDARCHISGSPGSLYHFGNRRHISLEVRDNSFNGYDFASRAHFSGSIAGSNVSIYDYERSKHYNYAI